MSEEKSKKDTGLFRLSGTVTGQNMKFGAAILAMITTLGGGGYLLGNSDAPKVDPQVIETMREDISDIKASMRARDEKQDKAMNSMLVELAKVSVALASIGDTRAQDKQEIQRQIDELRKALGEAATVREVAELKRRMAELERKVK